MSSLPQTQENIPTPTPTPTEVEQQAQRPEQQRKPKSANAARKHRATGSLVSLSNSEGQWVAFCETHEFSSPAAKTRNDAEVLRVKGDFCPQCAALLAAKSEPTSTPAPAENIPATEQQQSEPTTTAKPKTTRKARKEGATK